MLQKKSPIYHSFLTTCFYMKNKATYYGYEKRNTSIQFLRAVSRGLGGARNAFGRKQHREDRRWNTLHTGMYVDTGNLEKENDQITGIKKRNRAHPRLIANRDQGGVKNLNRTFRGKKQDHRTGAFWNLEGYTGTCVSTSSGRRRRGPGLTYTGLQHTEY